MKSKDQFLLERACFKVLIDESPASMKSKGQQLLEEAYRSIYLGESNEAAALEKFASDLHELWRAGWVKQNKGESLPNKVSPEQVKDTMVKAFGSVENGAAQMGMNASLLNLNVPRWDMHQPK